VPHGRGDWWIYGVLPLGVLHAVLFFTLQARPGRAGVVLWRWGPLLLILMTAALLAAALISATRSRLIWSNRRAAGLAGLLLLAGTTTLYRTYPSSYDETPSAVDFRLPLDGPVTVAWGGPRRGGNYHVSSPGERWSYDLLVTADGLTYTGDGRDVDDYHAYNRPIRAPANGTVVSAHDGELDAVPGHSERLLGAGNHIVMEVAPGQYLFVAHLKAGTVMAAAGDYVSQGEIIGRVGNSGNSSEPHVHLHLQDTPHAGTGEAIPFHFSDAVLFARPDIRRSMPRGGFRRGRYVGEVIVSKPDN
jgi:murein DD-endopeptidase MepM/ murein hydrolase activator NlpD